MGIVVDKIRELMKKLVLLLITVTNVSYASFPVSDTLKVKQDTVQTEKIVQYHLKLQKQGFDISNCMCESCRNSIAPLTNNRDVNKPLNQFKRIWLPIIITITVLSAILLILFPIKIGISSKAFSQFE